MPFTKFIVETFISEKATSVTECNAKNVGSSFPSFEEWISCYGFRIIFHNHVKPEAHHLALQLLRRTIAAFARYKSACESLNQHVASNGTNWSLYFEALSYFEDAISQLYQALDCSRKALKQTIFKRGDGSKEERLNLIYNSMRHTPAASEQPVWITNDGLEAELAQLSFSEIEEMLRMCGRICEKLCTGEANEGT